MLRKRKKLKKFQKLNLDMELKCPECGSTKIKKNNKEVVCKKCGFVIEENIIVCY